MGQKIIAGTTNGSDEEISQQAHAKKLRKSSLAQRLRAALEGSVTGGIIGGIIGLGIMLTGFALTAFVPGLAGLPVVLLLMTGGVIAFQVAILVILALTRENSLDLDTRRTLIWFTLLLSFINGPSLFISLGLSTLPALAVAGTGPAGLCVLALLGMLLFLAVTAAVFFTVDRLRYAQEER